MRQAGRLWLVIPWWVSATGAVIASESGISPRVFVPNFVGAALGLAVWRVLVRFGDWLGSDRGALALGTTCVVLLASTLTSSGSENVFRWIRIGPVALHVSSAVMPLILFAVTSALERRRISLAFTLLSATQTVHVLQPDAGQASAVGLAIVALAIRSRAAVAARIVATIVASAGALLAFVRADTLLPIPHVEGIVGLARAHGWGNTLLAWTAIALLLGPMLVSVARSHREGDSSAPLAASLAAYALATFVGSAFGHFPVPVLGAGAGPVIGASTYLALLLTVRIHSWGVTTRPTH